MEQLSHDQYYFHFTLLYFSPIYVRKTKYLNQTTSSVIELYGLDTKKKRLNKTPQVVGSSS